VSGHSGATTAVHTNEQIPEQSLGYSLQFQAETGLVQIRMVVHYFLNPAFGKSVKVGTH
jgi:hypothetical protein